MIDFISKYYLYVAALTALISVAYPFHFSPKEIRQHNRKLRYILYKLRQFNAIRLIHIHVGIITNIFDRIYGKPSSYEIRSLFTSRSLRVSVSIVVIYIILVPYASSAVYLSLTSKTQEDIMISSILLIYIISSYAVLLYTIKRYGLEEAPLKENIRHLLHILTIQFSLSSYVFTSFYVYFLLFDTREYFDLLQPHVPSILVILTVYVVTLVYIYIRFLHYSILVVAFYSVVSPLLSIASFYINKYFFLSVSLLFTGDNSSFLTYVFVLVSASIYIQSLMLYRWIKLRNYRSIRDFAICLLAAVYILNAQDIHSAVSLLISRAKDFDIQYIYGIIDAPHYILSIFIIYWITYGSILLIIYSNCYTDQISVIASRHVFYKISMKFRLQEILFWMIVDIFIALFVLVITALVFLFSMNLQLTLSELMESYAPLTSMTFASDIRSACLDIIEYYYAYSKAFLLVDFDYIWNSLWDAYLNRSNSYRLFCIVLSFSIFVFTLSPLIPTLINLFILLYVLIFYYGYLAICLYAKRIQRLIVIKKGSDTYKSQEGVRNILIFSAATSISMVFIFIVLESLYMAIVA